MFGALFILLGLKLGTFILQWGSIVDRTNFLEIFYVNKSKSPLSLRLLVCFRFENILKLFVSTFSEGN